MKNDNYSRRLKIRYLFAVSILLSLSYTSNGQDSFSRIVKEVLAGNAGAMEAYYEKEAGMKGAMTGILPSNPEVEAGFLKNSADPGAPRRDFSVVQSIDFPTTYFQKKKIASYRSQILVNSYKGYLRSLEIDVRVLCSELVYHNRTITEYERRVKNAEHLRDSYLMLYEKNNATIIDRNKAESYLISVRAELARLQSEREEIINTLAAFNGGKEPDIENIDYPPSLLPADFDEWFAEVRTNHPEIATARMREEESLLDVKLSKSEALPKISAGYMSESVLNESFRGLTLGLSVPLWENRNRTATARLHSQAAKANLEKSEDIVESRLQNYFNRARSLKDIAGLLRETIDTYSSEAYLRKALDAGGISLITYLNELEYQYGLIDKLALTERELNLVLPEITTLSTTDY